VVFDLDPGAPADIHTCCELALAVREVLGSVGLEAWAKTSGSKGLQLYVPVNRPLTHEGAASFALAVGQLLERQQPERVVTTMTKAVRPGKVFVDWSQNNRHKTTVAVYSLRARPRPTVSTPVTWDEVAACADGEDDLVFEAPDVLDRVERHGDLFAPVLTTEQELPGLTG
jgi:bifunctional non-homologous end joining protein LigD